MSFPDNLEEHCWLTELHSNVTRLKEEVRCEFARLRHTLDSRETSLLDQVDSIRQATTSLLVAQQLTTVRVKSKMEECAKHLKQSEKERNMASIRRITVMMENLKTQLEEAESRQDVPVPQLKFVHDANRLRRSILYYGKLKSDHEDISSIRSWDLVQENDASESVDSYEQKGCQSTPCYQQSKEIEDMEFACIESDDDFDFENIDLSQVCKANEICTTTSECVCDSPCYSKKLQKDHSGKATIFTKAIGSRPSEESGESRNLDRSVEIGQDDILHQISNSVEHLLSPNMSSPTDRTINDCSNMDHLQLKLRGILDGSKMLAFKATAMKSRNLTKIMDDCGAKQNACLRSGEYTAIEDLHNKLQHIFNQTGDSISSLNSKELIDKDFPSVVQSDHFETPSLICDLNARLQAIVDGSLDPDVEISESKESVLGEEMAHHEMSCNDLAKDNLFNILHGKTHSILENDSDVKEKMDDMSEIPELVKHDPVADLHRRIVHILQNDSSVSSEGADISQQNYECSDPISMLSSRMQSLVSG